MASHCPRCGATKTESVRHGLLYNLLWKMGYHLRRCSSCNRRRIFKRGDPTRTHPNNMSFEQLEADFNRKVADAGGRTSATRVAASPEAASERARGFVGQATQHSAAEDTSVATEKVDEDAGCPKCGSTHYGRSRRTFLERLLKRPRMARCMRCGHRFPYPI